MVLRAVVYNCENITEMEEERTAKEHLGSKKKRFGSKIQPVMDEELPLIKDHDSGVYIDSGYEEIVPLSWQVIRQKLFSWCFVTGVTLY